MDSLYAEAGGALEIGHCVCRVHPETPTKALCSLRLHARFGNTVKTAAETRFVEVARCHLKMPFLKYLISDVQSMAGGLPLWARVPSAVRGYSVFCCPEPGWGRMGGRWTSRATGPEDFADAATSRSRERRVPGQRFLHGSWDSLLSDFTAQRAQAAQGPRV